jgi:hypothetical protein
MAESEDDELRQKIEEIVRNPTAEGIEELARMRDTASPSVAVAAAKALLDLAFGPPGPESNEEFAVRLESEGIDPDEVFRKAAETLAKLRSQH